MNVRTSGRIALLCLTALFFHTDKLIAATGTVPPGACLYALDSTADRAFQIAGAQSVYTGCGVVVESSASDGLEMEGAGSFYLQNHAEVGVVGGAQLNGQTALWDTISNKQVAVVQIASPGDPLASVVAPTTGTIVGKTSTYYDMNSRPANNTLQPGVYCGGLSIGNTNGTTFTLSPGTYIMAGGGLTFNSLAKVTGAGVTIYNTSSAGWGCSSTYNYTPFTISGQTNITMSAPTSGALAGMLFFANRTGCATAGSCQDQINGGSTTSFNGALYLKSDTLLISGNNSSTGCMVVVADKIAINGNSSFGSTGCAINPIGVSVSPATATLNGGQSQQFTATVSNSGNQVVNWTISPVGVGSISTAGVYAAPSSVAAQQTVTVTASSQADSTKSATATVTLTPPVIVKTTPTITWATPGAIVYGTALSATQLDATASVAGAFVYTPAAGTVLKAGTQSLSVIFTPNNTTNYSTATATVTLTVTKATPSISWATPTPISYGTALSATQLDASFSAAGTCIYNPAFGFIPGAGTQTLSVNCTPIDTIDYNTATATVILTISKGTPPISWATPAAITYGTTLSATQLDATSTVAGTFAYTPAAGTLLTTGLQTVSMTFTPTDTADYNTASGSTAITVNKGTPTITWAAPVAITYGTALSATQLNASSGGVAGTFAYTPASGTVLGAGNDQTLSVSFTPTDAIDYNTATTTVALIVDKATPTITWTAPAAITYGTSLSETQLDATSTAAGSFAYTPTAGTVLTAGSQTLSGTFTPTDTVDYSTATASIPLVVNQATPTVTWAPASIVLGTPLGPTQLSATASTPGAFAYTPPSGTIPAVGTDMLSVSFTPTDTTDYVSVTQTVPLAVVPPFALRLPPAGIINTIVGNGTQGFLGSGRSALGAEMNGPTGVAVDGAGNVYIADAQNNVIRKVTASTGVIAIVAGNGTAGYSGDGGAAIRAQLYAPTGVALDAAGNIYVADTNNNVIREVNIITGNITSVAGTGVAGYSGDGGVATNAQLNSPTGIAIDAAGNIYIADAQNNAIREVNVLNGNILTVAGNSTGGDSGDGGPAKSAKLNFPLSVAVDGAGNIYIADTLNERIRKVSASTGIIAVFAGKGAWGYAGDGAAAVNAEFSNPTGLSVDVAGNVYIADIGNSVIREVTASTQVIATVAGNGTWGYSGDGGPAISAQLGIDHVDGIAVDAFGNIYIADADNNVIRAVGAVKMTPIVTLSASPSVVPSGAVTSTLTASVSSGTGTVTFSNGQGWISGALPVSNGIATASLDNAGWAVGTYTITASYSGDNLDNVAIGVTTLAVNSTSKATPTIAWSVPSPIKYGTALSVAQLNATASVPGTFVYSPAVGAVPALGTTALSAMFLPTDSTDYNAATANVSLSVNAATWSMPGAGIIDTVAGDGITGYSGDDGLATNAELTAFQSGIAVDLSGNIYIADWYDNVVRKVTAGTWAISTVAGDGVQGYSGDRGSAKSAELNGPAGVAVDALGNIYIADTGNNVIREVSFQTGIITTLAGNATIGYSGDGGPAAQAALYFPSGVSVAANGDLYVADTGNSVIRQVAAATGTITTVAGNGTSGYSGDGSSATGATLNAPSGVTTDASGNLYIADSGNNSIRAVYASAAITGVPSPVAGNIYTLVGNGNGAAIQAVLNSPQGITIDASGNIYIADSNNNQIRAVYSSGTLPGVSNPVPGNLYTLAGTGTPGYMGDGGPATSAELSGAIAVAVDAQGRVYIADTYNQVVRVVGAVGKSIPSIILPAPGSITYGIKLSATQLNATASVAGSMVYEPSAGTALTVGNHELAVTFTPADPTEYATVASTTTIAVNQATPVIEWAAPAVIVPGTVLSATQLSATASVPGTFVYSPASGTVPPAGTMILSVTFTPTDTVDYTSAASSVSLTVQQGVPVVIWPTPAPITYGTPLSSAQLSATASVSGAFSYSQPVGTVLPAGTNVLVVTFTPTDTTAYATVTATASLVVNQATPVITWATPSAITYGTPLSAAELNATASVPGTFSYNPVIGAIEPLGANLLTATFTPADAADYTVARAQVMFAVNQTLAPGTPLLQLRTNPTPSAVTLSNPQNIDWIVWGVDGSTTVATRMANGSLIGDMTPLGGATITADIGGQVGYNWTGGTPTGVGNGVAAEMNTSGSGAGFQISVPADTTARTLLLYLNINPNAHLTATMSDGSSPVLIHTPVSAQDSGNEIYSIDYRAASAGQTMTVQVISTDSSATVGLQAAVLQPHLPQVSILSPVAGQSFTLQGVPVIVNASQFDASIASVQLQVNGANSTVMSNAPYETSLVLPAGHYSLLAQATDTAGLTNTSTPVEFDVLQAGGSISESFNQLAPNETVDLTTEGTADWTLFPPSTNWTTQNRKAGTVPLISESIIGSQAYSLSTDVFYPGQFAFEDGTPDPIEPSFLPQALLLGGRSQGLGFQVVVPADTNPRTLRLYLQTCGTQQASTPLTMTAFLSDGSAPIVTDNSVTATTPTFQPDSNAIQYFYAINYNAATAGQSLTVRLTLQGQGIGQTCLNAASLSGGPQPLPIVNSIAPQSGIAGMKLTISGTGFGASQGSGTISIAGEMLTVLSWNDGSIQAVLPPGVQTGPIEVTTVAGASNTNVVFVLAPTLTTISPSSGPIGTVVTIAGSGFGASQEAGSVIFGGGISATPTIWTDTQIVVSAPPGASTGGVVVSQGYPASASPVFTVTSGTSGSPAPLVQVSISDDPSTTINLSDPENQDWALWEGDDPRTNVIRKAGANLIGSLPVVGGRVYSCPDNVQYSWTNGAPTANGTNVVSGICDQEAGRFQITAPADTTVRTLKIFGPITFADQLLISISDGSSQPVTYVPATGYAHGFFSIDYRAASAGQILTVQLTSPFEFENTIVEAVVLQHHLPTVTLVSPLNGLQFPAGASIPIGVDAMQYDSPINTINVSANGSALFSLPPSSPLTTWTPPSGHYSIQAQATDAAGLSGASTPIQLDVIGSGGTLSVAHSSLPSTPIDLTSEGTADWALFGCWSDSDWISKKLSQSVFSRKAGVLPLISSYSIGGDSPDLPYWLQQHPNPMAFAYHDGTPDNQETDTNCKGAGTENVAGDIEFTVSADTTPRTLRVYVGATSATGKLTAFLSDGSSPVAVDTSITTVGYNYGLFDKFGVYAITFAAASPGQTLTVRWMFDDEGPSSEGSEVGLFAASLDGLPVLPSTGPSILNIAPASGLVGTAVTLTGNGFGASQGNSTVTFNGVTAIPTLWSDTQIQVPAPVADNTGNVVVNVGGMSSDPVVFNMPPTITSLSSSSVVMGATLTISGGNFGNSGSVTVAGFTWAAVLSWSDSQVQIVVPSMNVWDCPQYPCMVQLSVNSSGSTNPVEVPLTILQYPSIPVVQWPTPSSITYGTPLTSTQLDATASVPGTFAYSPAPGTVLTAGRQLLSVTFIPTDNVTYTTATAQVTLTVLQAKPEIAWPVPAAITYGTQLSATQLNASSPISGVFTYTPSLGSRPIKGTNTLSATFNPSDSIDYAQTAATVSLIVTPGRAGIEIPPSGIIGPIAETSTVGLNQPFGIAVDSSGNVYIADSYNNVIREVNAATGALSIVVGSYTAGYAGDGALAVNAELNSPYGIAVDALGNLYIADTGNNAIREVNASSGIITTIAGDGTGKAGYLGDGGPATGAELKSPTGVAVDTMGNIYIADWLNNAIRKVSANTNTISTAVGDGTGKAGYLGDSGLATSAELNQPFGVAVDNTSGNATSGNIYVADSNNSSIRVVNSTSGVISTFAGGEGSGYFGDNGAATSARLNYPLGVAVDAAGNVAIADWLNSAIREVSINTGVIMTVAGNGIDGHSGDGGIGTSAEISAPTAVATDALVALFNPALSGSGSYIGTGSAGNNVYFLEQDPSGRVVGNPMLNTPAFLVPSGEYLAWSFPTSGSAFGSASATATSGSFYGKGSAKWSGFQMPSLPTCSSTNNVDEAVVNDVYAVASYTATSLNNLSANLSSGGASLSPAPSHGIGVSKFDTSGTSLPSTITANVTGTGEGSLNITSVAAAVTYSLINDCTTTPSGGGGGGGGGGGCGGGSCGGGGGGTPPPTPTYTLNLVDPYLLASGNAAIIAPAAAIAAGNTANGIIADGTSTAIAVLGINPNGGPAPTSDVTFSVNNGATLAPYDPSFLNTAPASWSTSTSDLRQTTLIVPAANLVQYGGSYYALALVTAGLPQNTTPGDEVWVKGLANGMNAGDPSELESTILAYPVPVALIHGLWGNSASLASTKKYLGSLGNSFLYAPCYSKYLAYWYTGSDPMPNAGSNCEFTSTQALDNTLKQVYSDIDGKGIVGGRVDVVAHSMGGLVTRFYSTSPGTVPYKNSRNRYQGTFRDIVTIDTPEIGSPLAWYLDNVLVNKTEDPSNYIVIHDFGTQITQTTPAGRLWGFFCGNDTTQTLRTCLNNAGPLPLKMFGLVKMPLAPPMDSDPLTRGSVASLIPGPDNSHLVNLPDPNIPNATWYAIASNYQAAGSSIPSSTEQFLDTMFPALYPNPINFNNQPPSIAFMMSDGPQARVQVCNATSTPTLNQNDIIVPVCSQTWHAVPGQTYTFSGLAHSSTPGWSAINLLLHLGLGASSDANVTDSSAVNQLVAYWLSGQSGASPVPATVESESKPMESLAVATQSLTTSPEMQTFSADDRLTITSPGRSVELAQPLRLQLSLTKANVSSIVVTQNNEDSALTNLSSGVEIGSGNAKIVEDHGLTKMIEVVPLQVGTVQLGVLVSYADGGISMKTLQLDVVPGYTGVKTFHLDQGFSTIPLELTDNPEGRQHWMYPEVEYDQLDYPVKLKDSTSVTIVVDQPEDNPVISVDSNGMVHALRLGKARITGSFAGLEDTVEVDVRATPLVR